MLKVKNLFTRIQRSCLLTSSQHVLGSDKHSSRCRTKMWFQFFNETSVSKLFNTSFLTLECTCTYQDEFILATGVMWGERREETKYQSDLEIICEEVGWIISRILGNSFLCITSKTALLRSLAIWHEQMIQQERQE